MEKKQESRIISNSLAESGEQNKVVVITVWYNRAEHVEKSIGSLLNQTADNYTIFAVDDGSTDDTGERLEEMLSKAEANNVPMRVWRKPNEGFVLSIKRAIEEKTDERIIALHGAGDISLPERLETQYNKLEEYPEVNTIGVGSQQITEIGKKVKEITPPEWPQVDLKKGKLPRPGAHGAAMYYREDYNSAGGYRELFIYAQDMDLWLRLKEIGDIYTIQKILYKPVLIEGSVSESGYETRLEQIFCDAAAHQSAKHRQNGLTDPVKKVEKINMDTIIKIAKIGGLHERTVRLICEQAIKCLLNKNSKGVAKCLKKLDYQGALVLMRISPYLLKRYMEKTMKLPGIKAGNNGEKNTK